MKLFKSDFDKLYEELSILNEAKLKHTLGNFRGFSAGGVETVDPAVKNLAAFVDVDKTLAANPNVQLPENPEYWPIASRSSNIYYFRCTKCQGIYPKTATALKAKISETRLNSKKYNRDISVEEFCQCQWCARQDKTNNTDEILGGQHQLGNRPDLMDRLHPTIAVDGKLTAEGCKILYDLNYEHNNVGPHKHQVSSKFIDMIKNSPGMDLTQLSLDSPLILRWRCKNSDHSDYDRPLMYVYKNIYKGCNDCLNQSKGRQFSTSEQILADMIEEYLVASNLNYKFKAGYKDDTKQSFLPTKYHTIDIYLEINGKKYAIEYDGKLYHKTQEAIDTDIQKTNYCIKNGIEVIRVREALCHDWSSPNITAPNIKIFTINYSFTSFSESRRKEIVEAICKYIGII